MINRIIRNFVFDEAYRSQLVFSDAAKIRLNSEDPSNPKLQLRADINGEYSLSTNLYITTGMMNPNALLQWLKFEALVVEDPDTFGLPVGASLGFKVKTPAGDYWWSGAAWAVAGANDWSTEAQLNTNLPSFPLGVIGSREIGFVIKLQTTDPKITPELKELKLVGNFEIEYVDDLVYDTLIRKLNTEFRSSSLLRFQTSASIADIDLSTVLENKGYNITGIRRVTNLTDDPLKLTNLLDAYAAGVARQDGFTFDPGTVTFTAPIPTNKLVEIVFEYLPEIYVRQSQDYYEVPKYPTIVFENMEEIADSLGFSDTNSAGEDYVRDKANLTAVLQRSPVQKTLRFEYAVYTNSQTDQMRLTGDINRYLNQTKVLRTWGLDYECSTRIMKRLETIRNKRDADNTDSNVSEGVFDVIGVLSYHKLAEDVPLVAIGQPTVTSTVL